MTRSLGFLPSKKILNKGFLHPWGGDKCAAAKGGRFKEVARWTAKQIF